MATTVGVVRHAHGAKRAPSRRDLTLRWCLQPIALGALLIIDGAVSSTGLLSPSSPEVWRPLLASLESAGITMTEQRSRYWGQGLEKEIGHKEEEEEDMW